MSTVVVGAALRAALAAAATPHAIAYGASTRMGLSGGAQPHVVANGAAIRMALSGHPTPLALAYGARTRIGLSGRASPHIVAHGAATRLGLSGGAAPSISAQLPPPPSPSGYAALGPADFAAAIGQRLLPRGLAWTRLAGSVLQGFWQVIAGAIAAVHARTGILTEVESFPPASVELLPDWERVLGLPDPCLGVNPATAARQASVANRLAGGGGQSIAYYMAVARQLGGAIAVTEYAPFRLGVDHFGMPLRNASWAYAWLVNLDGAQLFRFEWDVSAWGEPFWQVPGGAIVCELQRLAPAHTVLIFGAGLTETAGPFLADFSLTDSGAYAT